MDDQPIPDSRRQIDAVFEHLLEVMQQAIDVQLAESRDAHERYSVMIERILALQERFMEHDRRETDDRKIIMATLERVSSTLAAHAEAIAALKQWDMIIAGVLGSAITGVVGWIITHLSASR